MDINDIPLELLLIILSYIPQNELCYTISQVCRHWNKLSILPDFWRTFFYDDLSKLPRSSSEKYSKVENRVAHIRNIQTFIQDLSINRIGIQDIKNSKSEIVFSNLKHLHIPDEINGHLFKDVLKRCLKLQALDLHMYNSLTCSFELFCGLDLKEIQISCLIPTSETLANDLIFLTETNPNLEKLYLDLTARNGNSIHSIMHLTLGDNIIRQILMQSRNLKTLAFGNCSMSSKGFTSCGIIFGLTELTISNCYWFDDDGIECITRNTKNLLVLEILECNNISDKGIASIAENCPRLLCLSIYHSHVGVQITNESLMAIAHACRI
ncbi:Hypothetical predicted protein [Mytilus galloprovincialis]|uniref:F-box domain-containing protein n=1 Tax=Mytilus galloprovincialis TaxID=29158 RepID=A0A8B6FPU4_MYTGA|nr:Hypothetical predicted protein [Mytilus galloprovincialis]